MPYTGSIRVSSVRRIYYLSIVVKSGVYTSNFSQGNASGINFVIAPNEVRDLHGEFKSVIAALWILITLKINYTQENIEAFNKILEVKNLWGRDDDNGICLIHISDGAVTITTPSGRTKTEPLY